MSMPQQTSELSGAEDGRGALVRGLLLMRASSMSLMRFQLAMERRDRAVALRTADEMVAIDGKLRDFLKDMPAPDGSLAGLVEEVEKQRASLVRETLTLVAGRSGPAVSADGPAWAEPVQAPSPDVLVLDEALQAPPRARRAMAWIALAMLIASALALVAWWFGADPAARLSN